MANAKDVGGGADAVIYGDGAGVGAVARDGDAQRLGLRFGGKERSGLNEAERAGPRVVADNNQRGGPLSADLSPDGVGQDNGGSLVIGLDGAIVDNWNDEEGGGLAVGEYDVGSDGGVIQAVGRSDVENEDFDRGSRGAGRHALNGQDRIGAALADLIGNLVEAQRGVVIEDNHARDAGVADGSADRIGEDDGEEFVVL